MNEHDAEEPRTAMEAWSTIRQAMNVAQRCADDDHHAKVVARDIAEFGGVGAVLALAKSAPIDTGVRWQKISEAFDACKSTPASRWSFRRFAIETAFLIPFLFLVCWALHSTGRLGLTLGQCFATIPGTLAYWFFWQLCLAAQASEQAAKMEMSSSDQHDALFDAKSASAWETLCKLHISGFRIVRDPPVLSEPMFPISGSGEVSETVSGNNTPEGAN